MDLRSALRRPRTWIIGVPIVLVLAFVAGPFVYINLIEGDAPDRLTLDDPTTTSTPAASGGSASGGSTGDAAGVSIDGSWALADGSQAGYRVDEVLFGQDAEAVGRTSDVTGQLLVSGTTIDSASFDVDLTTVASDEGRRDNQFRTRIMDTATFPTATFELTEPVELSDVPADLEEVTTTVTGDLTLRGVTNEVSFDLTARRNGDTIEVNGTIPVTFADYDIPDPSFGPASVSDSGEIEFLLVFELEGP
jgi:polyisoprenoid-binding protein YceI